MFHYIYVLESERSKDPYVGYATNLRARLKEHNGGKSQYTKKYLPWRIIHYEAYLNIEDARRREKYLKTNRGAQVLKRMLKSHYQSKLDSRGASRMSTT